LKKVGEVIEVKKVEFLSTQTFFAFVLYPYNHYNSYNFFAP